MCLPANGISRCRIAAGNAEWRAEAYVETCLLGSWWLGKVQVLRVDVLPTVAATEGGGAVVHRGARTGGEF